MPKGWITPPALPPGHPNNSYYFLKIDDILRLTQNIADVVKFLFHIQYFVRVLD